jgi:peptidoglycan/LPS O-acetylase OafA/YrhL
MTRRSLSAPLSSFQPACLPACLSACLPGSFPLWYLVELPFLRWRRKHLDKISAQTQSAPPVHTPQSK